MFLTPLLLMTQLMGPAEAHTPPRPGQSSAHAGHAASQLPPHPQDMARRDRLRRMLSIRDVAPACTELAEAHDPRLVDDLQWLMDHIKAPPWVGVRAAQCIITLHAESELTRIEGWMQDAGKPGLALLVLGSLNNVSAQTAQTIAQAALKGPHAEKVRPRLVKSRHPEVRALVPPKSIKP